MLYKEYDYINGIFTGRVFTEEEAAEYEETYEEEMDKYGLPVIKLGLEPEEE